ncbi:DUF7660 family protein [Longimicrobium terrae]|uniref:DUF7660 domain-containing protein n=1 Tax=Longimicrobium terrae TaxID=1639882 RepID=A0A841H0R3_9BACT|nr:hypothetical protein [Longimicrobium terrae]MBB4637181.1 hypothetical protein [Longimicrobium terrae]MBB6071558.1 hypothetical protein [Longimicrobium terrae]NNC30023.1 hypothetical protein [Longimicrobium terrae]
MNSESELPDLDDTDDDAVEAIETRQQFAEFVRRLSNEIRNHPGSWENSTLADFLEAAAAWSDDMDGLYANQNRANPDVPEWRMFAMILSAARIYE